MLHVFRNCLRRKINKNQLTSIFIPEHRSLRRIESSEFREYRMLFNETIKGYTWFRYTGGNGKKMYTTENISKNGEKDKEGQIVGKEEQKGDIPFIIPPISPSVDSFYLYPPESYLSPEELKRRRRIVARRTIMSTLRILFPIEHLYALSREYRLVTCYLIFTTLLLVFYFIKPKPMYYFYTDADPAIDQNIESVQYALNRKPVVPAQEGDSYFTDTTNAFKAILSRYSPVIFCQKLGYFFASFYVAHRALWNLALGRPLTEAEKIREIDNPSSLADILEECETQHVSKLAQLLGTGHFPSKPWRAILPPSPWAPHLTLYIDSSLLYTIMLDDNGQTVLRKRPYADYLMAQLHECSEIILSSHIHTKTTAPQFFKLFDPYRLASHYITKEDHRWTVTNFLKPLEENHLGRRPERLVVLDSSLQHCGSMCSNVLRISLWDGNEEDSTLFELVPLLKYLANGIEEGIDTREVIRQYENKKSSYDIIKEHVRYTGFEPVEEDSLLKDKILNRQSEPPKSDIDEYSNEDLVVEYDDDTNEIFDSIKKDLSGFKKV
ncbi:uncharacterized protein LOC126322560 isoform X2 [Schistocerca gregaria]|uniref:uncharacterized protein LOC126322560 isoform X2 n=1 Tax=Schistocerca gregaria TaxID=7010 RepID=UPI00211EB1C0|nr:uncharacterized protein LOC126322560 isoform X2 [Schistocerca gregaria]